MQTLELNRFHYVQIFVITSAQGRPDHENCTGGTVDRGGAPKIIRRHRTCSRLSDRRIGGTPTRCYVVCFWRQSDEGDARADVAASTAARSGREGLSGARVHGVGNGGAPRA